MRLRPTTELIALRRYGLGLHPRTVVWFFYEGNDLSDIDGYDETVRNWDAIQAEDRSYRARSFFLNLYDPLGFWLDQLRWRPSEYARRRCGHLRPEIPGADRITYLSDPPFAMDDVNVRRFGRLEDILLAARADCQQRDVRFLVVFAPIKGRVYPRSVHVFARQRRARLAMERSAAAAGRLLPNRRNRISRSDAGSDGRGPAGPAGVPGR